MIEVTPPMHKPAEHAMNGADQPRARSTASRLSAVPPSAASMATSAGAVSRQPVQDGCAGSELVAVLQGLPVSRAQGRIRQDLR